MYRIVFGVFSQESNTFSPLTCTRKNFETNSVSFGDEIVRDRYGKKTHSGAMVTALTDAEDVELIPSAAFQAGANGRVDRAVYDEFMACLTDTIQKAGKIDGVFLCLHGGTCLTDEDDACGLLLETVRKQVGEKVVIAASCDTHANITKRIVDHVDVICGYRQYPHTDKCETANRAFTLGMNMLRYGTKYHTVMVKVPMILQAEAANTKAGPIKELLDDAARWQEEGKFADFSLWHMQPWLDIPEAGGCAMVIAEDKAAAEEYAMIIGRRFLTFRHILQYHPMSIDEGLDLAASRPGGHTVVLSDAADNTSGGATGDSVEVLSRILEREMDLRAALVVVDPEAAALANRLGEGAEAEFSLGGKRDPRRQKTITVRAKVQKVCDPRVLEMVGPNAGNYRSFGEAAVLRVRNTDIVVVKYPQCNFTPTQFTGFGLVPTDYDMLLVKSSLAYKACFGHITPEMHNILTNGATSSNLVGLGFEHVQRPLFPFDDPENLDVYPPYEGRTAKRI